MLNVSVGDTERIPDVPVTADYCLRTVDTAGKTTSTAQREPREKDGKHALIIIIIIIIITRAQQLLRWATVWPQ